MLSPWRWRLSARWTAQAPGPGQPIDWDRLRPEILERYRDLVQIDSTPGRETLVVNYLKKVLEAEGIPTQTFALDPDRANLVARLKGNGSKRPLLILAHTDVVGVQREKWPVDPFGAVLKDGYIWGRGSKDDKPVLAANLMTMLLLKRRGVPLDRDVIFLAESAEEADYHRRGHQLHGARALRRRSTPSSPSPKAAAPPSTARA